MKVYLLTSQYSYEDYTVHGAYSTKEKAEEVLRKEGQGFSGGFDIEEYELDAGASGA